MFDIGESLAAARQARGLSLADAERLTCIRAKQLAALESESFDALPGRAYARAFLRSYAGALGLDADRFVAEFENRVPEPEEDWFPAPRAPRRPIRGVRPALTVAAIAVLVTIAAWSASSHPSQLSLPKPAPVTANQPERKTAGVLGAHTSITKQPEPLVIRATRGNCWLLVRRGTPTGPVLYENTLRRGEALRFAASRVWVRLGAPGMVDVQRGGRFVRGLTGLTPTNIVA